MVNYEGYEDLGGFHSPRHLVAYRQMLLEKTQPQVSFIDRHIPIRRHLAIVEIGCGNGRLLVGLAAANRLKYGLGIDTSRSRIEFAGRWVDDLGYDDRTLLESWNVLDLNPLSYTVDGSPSMHLAVCITGCFQYFAHDDTKKVLYFMRKSAMYALFELYHRPANLRSWHKLPDSDRFAYLLDDYTPENPTTHTKTFIGRDGSVDIRTEQLYYYGDEEFRQLLAEAGFTDLLWDVSDNEKRVVLVT